MVDYRIINEVFSVILPFTYGGIYGLYQANFFQDRGLVQIKSLWNAAPSNYFSHPFHVKLSFCEAKPNPGSSYVILSPDTQPVIENLESSGGCG